MNMVVSVVGQKMYVSSCMDCIVAGSQNFVKFKFNLSSNWNNLITFAQFRQNEQVYNRYLDKDNSVYLPSSIKEGTCTLMLYGSELDSENPTIGTTNFLTLKIEENIIEPDADGTDVPQHLYDQLIAKINNVASLDNIATLPEVVDFLNI